MRMTNFLSALGAKFFSLCFTFNRAQIQQSEKSISDSDIKPILLSNSDSIAIITQVVKLSKSAALQPWKDGTGLPCNACKMYINGDCSRPCLIVQQERYGFATRSKHK